MTENLFMSMLEQVLGHYEPVILELINSFHNILSTHHSKYFIIVDIGDLW
jgi:hypothetical protein